LGEAVDHRPREHAIPDAIAVDVALQVAAAAVLEVEASRAEATVVAAGRGTGGLTLS